MLDQTNQIEKEIAATLARPAPKTPRAPTKAYSYPVLNERQLVYGDFKDNAEISQSLKFIMEETPGWERLNAIEAEALHMICTKIGRILGGNPNHKDSWLDLAGYAMLVAERV